MGRLVITHSTYLEGLIPLLKRLVQRSGDRHDHPGGDRPGAGPRPRAAAAVSTPISGGWKLVARRGSSAQEVFVVHRPAGGGTRTAHRPAGGRREPVNETGDRRG
jgi:hypothetical protein